MKVEFTCETCGKQSVRRYASTQLPLHFFCSTSCQHQWQKTRKDIIEKNKNPDFRKKVSEGLKVRKQKLGNDYHSAETKKKIGLATSQRWNNHSEEKRSRLLQVLRNNATQRRTFGAYDFDWQKLSVSIKKKQVCHRCGAMNHLCLHHIIPVSANGTRELNNLVPLCSSCHRTVDHYSKKILEMVGDWEIVRLLIKERLHMI